jgi:GNAT superfamily N-acetyltransferase
MEHDAFGGNPDWEGCYCREGHWPGTTAAADEEEREENKAHVVERIRNGRHTGLLAYQADRVVGWCHAEPLAWMENPRYLNGRKPDAVADVGAIVCFNLAESHRRLGLPGVMLREALKRFAGRGLTAAEAFPWREPAPRPGRNYLGTVHLYELHGFRPAGEIDDAVIMRRPLTKETHRT